MRPLDHEEIRATPTTSPANHHKARSPVVTEPDGELVAPRPADLKRSSKKLQLLIGSAVLVLGVATTAYYLQCLAPFESTDNASIEGRVTPVAPQVSGRIARLLVEDNQEVRQGDLLLEIDPCDYEARLAKAQASLAAANSRLEQAHAQLAVDQAKVGQEKASASAVEAEADRAQADLKRYQAVESRAVSRSQLDLAESQARAALAQVEVARNKAIAAEALVGLSKASAQTATADVGQCEAAVREADLNLSYTRVTAPQSGRVTRRNAEAGAFVQPGQTLMAVVPRQFWVVANFKETQLARMRPGQPVEIKVDAYPGLKLAGRIESIQSGAGARFSLFPPENATGNFIKVVQRVPVKIVFDTAPDAQLALGPGLSVEPRVRVR